MRCRARNHFRTSVCGMKLPHLWFGVIIIVGYIVLPEVAGGSAVMVDMEED